MKLPTPPNTGIALVGVFVIACLVILAIMWVIVVTVR
jgi:hypothetical protein